MRPIETEVCILGGGPAGAVAAWKLARLGHTILVIERAAFPRPHAGEALSPGIWPQLDLLGLTSAVCAAGFRPTAMARVRWSGPPERTETVRRPDPPGLIVDRGRFDHLLLEHARQAGARVLQPALALRPRRADGAGRAGAGWIVPVRTPEGDRKVRARFLVDASGRAACLGGRQARTGPRTLALFGSWARRGGWDDALRIEAGPDEWLWAAPRPDGTLSAMVFVGSQRYRAVRQAGISREVFYRGLLARSALLAEMAGAQLVGPEATGICDATCRHDPEPAGDGFLKIGEAAFTLDPLSSTGVQKALQTAWSGAIAVHTILTRPEGAVAARRFYAESHRSTVERHAAWAAGFYAEARQHAGNPFWRRRSAAAVPLTARPTGLPVTNTGLRLSPAAALVETPCVAGDYIETRCALAHPALERPIAFLDGVEIAPLLESIPAGATLDELAVAWSPRLSSPRQAATLADWLVRRGVLVPA